MEVNEAVSEQGRSSFLVALLANLGLVTACSVLPALILAVGFGRFLEHRSDYLGHYLAGCGGTMGVTIVILSVIPARLYPKLASLTILITCIAAVALGAVFESTIYRLAKFDEVDFFNQSLGAVLAACGLHAAWCERKPSVVAVLATVVVSVGLLQAGYHYAFR